MSNDSASHIITKATAALPQPRLGFIDILRGIACVWMIETHVVNACLSWGYRQGWLFNLLNTTNGYVSVTFIFCAGAGFWLAASRKADEYKAFAPSFWQYVRRIGFILLVAYWLHVPEFSLQKYLLAAPERQNILFICDVLHAIVVASLLALACLLLLPNLRVLRWAFAALACLFIFYAPYVWQLEPDTFLPRIFGSYISRPPAAAFPIFPWCGYFFIGAALTGFFMEVRELAARRRLAKWLIVAALCIPAATLYLQLFTPYAWVLNYGWGQNWYLSSPGNCLFRVSGSVLLYATLFLLEERIMAHRVGERVAGWLQLMGKESLFVYVFHLMLVYGSPVNLGLGYFTGHSFKPIAAIIVTTAMVIAVYHATELWHSFKLTAPHKQKRAILVFACLFGTIFLVTTPTFVDWSKSQIDRYFPQAAEMKESQ